MTREARPLRDDPAWGEGVGPRVLFITHSAAPSGAELSLLTILPALRAEGVRVRVLLGESGPLESSLRQQGVDVQVLPMPERAASVRRRVAATDVLSGRALSDAVKYVLSLRREIRRLTPDIVETESMKAHLTAGVAGRLLGIPVVWRLHDRVSPDYMSPLLIGVVRLAARVLPAHVVANSGSTAATAPRPLAGKVSVVPIAVQPTPRVTRVRGQDVVVGHVGRLTPWKGQALFLRAFATAFAVGRVRAVIAGGPLFGEDDYAASLRVLAERLGIADRVEFTGHRADVSGELARFDALVHSSLIPEPFGQVVVEGMAAGLAVVASNEGGPAEIIDDGRTGLLVRPRDEQALGEALVRLAASERLRRDLGDGARVASFAYRPALVARALRNIYEHVARAHQAGTSDGRVAPQALKAWKPWTSL